MKYALLILVVLAVSLVACCSDPRPTRRCVERRTRPTPIWTGKFFVFVSQNYCAKWEIVEGDKN